MSLRGSAAELPRFAVLRHFAASRLGSVWIALVLFHFLYRVRLVYVLYHVPPGDPPILGFIPGLSSRIDLLSCVFVDFVVTCAVALVIGGLMYAPSIARRFAPALGSRWVQHTAAVAGLLLVAFISCLHFSLLWHLHKAPTRTLVAASAGQEFSLSWYASYVTATDLGLLLSPVALYALARWTALGVGPWVVLALLTIGASSAPVYLLQRREMSRRAAMLDGAMNGGSSSDRVTSRGVSEEIRANPARWFAKFVMWARPSTLMSHESSPGPEQQRTVGFVDPAFVVDRGGVPPTQRPDSPPWNVVVVLLESLGAQYVDLENGRYMPNLHRLAGEGLNFSRHYSSGVDTDYAVFSGFTGLYPMPAAIQYVSRSDLHVPTLFSRLSGRPSLLVTPSDLRLWFPVAMLRNSGLSDVWDAENVPLKARDFVVSDVQDEAETATFFLERLGKLREPFVAVYYAYATHSPYFIQDGAHLPSGAGRRDHYIHNATLVDAQVGRIEERIRVSGLGDRTILVVLADHGEAFGEHTGNFGHGFFLFDESVRVPAVFYQPKLFAPTSVSEVTSHVDVLPTLLDAMGVAFDPLSFEGESVLRALRRKYIFLYSPKSERLASVSRDGVKVIVDYESDTCDAYDTKADPGEARALSCDRYATQRSDLGVYHQFQPRLLEKYVGSCAAEQGCRNGAPL
jgi:hypothetical protein